MDLVFRYYAVDWLATVGTLVSLWMLGEQRRFGFVVGAAAAAGWFAFGVLTGSAAALIANTLLFVLNLRGYRRW